MTRREMRDTLGHHLTAAAIATRAALDRYNEPSDRVQAAREIGTLLRAAYGALELAEAYRQLVALEIDEASLEAGRLIPAVPPWKVAK